MLNNSEIPMGLSMAMAENPEMLNEFAGYTQQQRQEIINRTHDIISKEQMRSFVNNHFSL